MRAFAFPIALALLTLLSACGNGNDGRAFSPYKKATSSAVNANNSSVTGNGAPQVLQLLPCKNPLFIGPNSDFNALFAGSVLCPGQGSTPGSQAAIARLKVNSSMPANTRLCIIPFAGDYPATETCFAINGQIDIALSTAAYTSFIVLAENSLASYKAFLVNPALTAPPLRVLYSM